MCDRFKQSVPAAAQTPAFIDTLLTVLRLHTAHADVQLFGICMISGLLSAAAESTPAGPHLLQRHAVGSGYVEVVVEAMRVHRTAVVHFQGCDAVTSMVAAGSPWERASGRAMPAPAEILTRAGAAGAVEAVHMALRTHIADAEVQLCGFAALRALITLDANAQRAIRAGVLHLPPPCTRTAYPELAPMRDAVMNRLGAAAAAAADAAAAELLASEEAEHAAAASAAHHDGTAGGRGSKGKKRAPKKTNRAAAGAPPACWDDAAAGAPAPLPSAATQQDIAETASAFDDGDGDDVAPALSSASAVRRRRRAAAKATRRSGATSGAHAAEAAEEPQPASSADEERDGGEQNAMAGDAAAVAAAPAAAPVPPAVEPVVAIAVPQHAQDVGGGGGAAEVEDEAVSMTCVVCLDAPRSVLLLPCKHLTLCAAPGCTAMLGAPPRCPLCRVVVTDTFSGVFF
jgi:hypothetical protein